MLLYPRKLLANLAMLLVGAGLTPGLGSGGATPSLGSDYGSETPYGGVGLGATPGLGSDEPQENGTTVRSLLVIPPFARRSFMFLTMLITSLLVLVNVSL